MASNFNKAQAIREAISIYDGSIEKDALTVYNGDPNGLVTASIGALVIDYSGTGKLWSNTDGGTTWTEKGSSTASWQEFIFTYSNFSTAALTNTLNVVNLVGKTISQTRVKHSAAFSGTGITAYTVKLGITGELDRYSSEFDVFQTASASALKRSIVNLEEDVSVKITAESTGANLDQASTGSVSVKLLLTDTEAASPMNSEFVFGAGIGDGVNPITTGEVGSSIIPYNGTILGWYIIGDTTGSIVVDIWKDTFANYPPTVGDTITGTEKPTLASQNKNSDLTLTTWNTSVLAGDVVRFKVDSVDGILKSVNIVVLCSRG
jgi:hypothetical protein